MTHQLCLADEYVCVCVLVCLCGTLLASMNTDEADTHLEPSILGHHKALLHRFDGMSTIGVTRNVLINALCLDDHMLRNGCLLLAV